MTNKNAKNFQKSIEGQKTKIAPPTRIKELIDDYVIGQESAKKIMAVSIYNHYKMVNIKHKMVKEGNKDASLDLSKSNILIVGPSGAGKTHLIRVIARLLNIPFVIEDASSFTASGYVGRDVETMLRDLVEAAGGNIPAAERGIIYIDEIDKISRKGENLSTTSDPSNEAVQQALLKMIEGSMVEVPVKGQRNHPQAETIKVNTENILFIVGGSFESIEKIISKRVHKSAGKIGFFGETKNMHEQFNDLILEINNDDLRKFGMLPEFLGRLPVICPMQELTEDELVRILTEPKDAIIKQYQTLFNADGITLEFTEKTLRTIAKDAIKRKVGARGLRSIIEKILEPIMYVAPSEEGLESVIIDVNDNTDSDDKYKVIKNYAAKEAAVGA